MINIRQSCNGDHRAKTISGRQEYKILRPLELSFCARRMSLKGRMSLKV
jgi:hypothetical protein